MTIKRRYDYTYLCRNCKETFFTPSDLRPSHLIAHDAVMDHECWKGEFEGDVGIGDLIRYRQVADGEVGA